MTVTSTLCMCRPPVPPVPKRRNRTQSSGSTGSAGTPDTPISSGAPPYSQDTASPTFQGGVSLHSETSQRSGSYTPTSQGPYPPTSQGSYPPTSQGVGSPTSQGSYPSSSQGPYPPTSQGSSYPPSSQSTYSSPSQGSYTPNTQGSYPPNTQGSTPQGSYSSRHTSGSQGSYTSSFQGSCPPISVDSSSPASRRTASPYRPTAQENIKQHFSLDSTGSSGESNTDAVGSPAPSIGTEVPHDVASVSGSASAKPPQDTVGLDSSSALKMQLAELRRKREGIKEGIKQGTQTESQQSVASSNLSNSRRRSKTVNMGGTIAEEPADQSLTSSSSYPSFSSHTSSTPPSSIKHPPGRPQPTFHNDPILESKRTTPVASPHLSGDRGEVPTHQSQISKERLCIQCQKVLPIDFKFCGHCGASWTPPLSSMEEKGPPAPRTVTRASAADTSRVEQVHRTELQAAAAGDTIAFSPVLHQKSDVMSHDNSRASRRVNSGKSGVDEIKEKEEAYKRHLEKQAAAREDPHSSPPSTHKASPPSSHKEEQDLMSGLDYLKKKEEAYKQAQLKRGVREEDIEPLQERIDAEKRYKEKQKAWHREQASARPPPPQPQVEEQQKKVKFDSNAQKKDSKAKPNPLNFKRENLLKNNYMKENDEATRMAALENDGQNLLKAIKVRAWIMH